MMKLFLPLLFLASILTNCSSSKLVDEYINEDNTNFKGSKILVVGLTPDGGLQRQFEFTLVKALNSENIQAEKSVDYFLNLNDIGNPSEEDLENLETQLITDGFDAVLFSKITGTTNKVSLAQSYRNLSRTLESFQEYYQENRPITNTSNPEEYPVYNTETSLYCLCPEKNQDLIWRGKIDIINPPRAEKTIQDYVKTLMRSLKRRGVLNKSSI